MVCHHYRFKIKLGNYENNSVFHDLTTEIWKQIYVFIEKKSMFVFQLL